MRPRLPLLALGLLLLAPPVHAGGSPPAGSPQLSDPSGDVRYAEEYVGPRDRNYLDLEQVWFEYDNGTDAILLFVQFRDTRPLQALPPDRTLQCHLDAAVEGGDPGTSVTYLWQTVPRSKGIASSVTWKIVPAEGLAKGARHGPLQHDVVVDFREHGTVQFEVLRAPLLRMGSELRDVRIRCDEWWEPPLHGPAFIQQNYDAGVGNGSFGLDTHEPAAQALVPDPWELGTGWIAPTLGVGVVVRLVVAWWLYARIDRSDVLKNPARARVHELVQQNPGIRQRQLMRLSDLGWGTLVHHLRTLQARGLVKKVQFHGFSCYFAADSKAALSLAALQTPTARSIFEEIQKRPGVTAGQLARERNVHASSIAFHIRRLIDAGLLVRTRTRAGFELRAAEASGAPRSDHPAASAVGTA